MKKLLITIFLAALGACNTEEFLDVKPEDQYTTLSVYQSEIDMILAVNGLYTYLPHLDADRGEQRMWFWTDDGWRRRGRFGTDMAWTTDRAEEFLNFYTYEGVRQCNEVIKRLPDANFNTEGLRERLSAEARFMRAWLYERMVFLYGDVALVTENESVLNPARTARLEVFDFVISELQEISAILPESYNTGDQGRFTKWASLAVLARANLNAVGWHPNTAILYDNAQSACQEIINAGGFTLDQGVQGFSKLFTSDSDFGARDQSKAVILSRVYIPGELFYDEFANRCLPRGSYQGFGDGSGNNQAQFAATWNLISSFQTINGKAPADELGTVYFEETPYENMDPRLKASFILPGDALQTVDGGGAVYYNFQPHPDLSLFPEDIITSRTGVETGLLIRKYAGLGVDNDSTITYDNPSVAHADYKIIRYAEVLLMMAECLAADNNDEALTYINMVRKRVDMPSYNSIADVPLALRKGTTGNDLLDAVLLERRYEFAGEGFQRMSDIWRYRLGDQVFGIVEGISTDPARPGALTGERYQATERIWDDKYYLFPLPPSAIELNPNINQNNPGW